MTLKSLFKYKQIRQLLLIHIVLTLLFVALLAPAQPKHLRAPTPALELQGHRGARGLAPENTLPSFFEAYRYGMTTLELDVSLTADGRLVIYHDLEINRDLCRDQVGQIPAKRALLKMKSSEVHSLDCGSQKNVRFPQQASQKAHPPYLSELIAYEKLWGYTPLYNVEIKIRRDASDQLRRRSVDALARELKSLQVSAPSLEGRVTVQSFDLQVLKFVQERLPHLRRSALFEPFSQSGGGSLQVGDSEGLKIIQKAHILGVGVISPYDQYVTPAFLKAAHEAHLKVIPWTVNDQARMKSLITMGVDGLISDYPDRLAQVVIELGEAYECRTRHADSACTKPIIALQNRTSLTAPKQR